MKKQKYDSRAEIERTPVLQIPENDVLRITGTPTDAEDWGRILVLWFRRQGCSFLAIAEAYPSLCSFIFEPYPKRLKWTWNTPPEIGDWVQEKCSPYRWGRLVEWRMCNGKSLEPVIRDIEDREFFTSGKLLKLL